jgi:hypothetical protein
MKEMDPFYSELAEVLRGRLSTIADHETRDRNPEEHLQKLKQLSEKLELLKKRLPAEAHPMLAHYLERMSLSKALEFIEANYADSSPR